MTEVEAELDTLVGDWLTLPAVAERLGESPGRVRQLVRDGRLAAVRRGKPPELAVPAAFVGDGMVLKGLPGTLTLLRDAGYDEEAALRWLFTPDASLPGAPIAALIENRGTEVKRRAQALAF
ncbi:MAG: Rv2175c family DNA-binding protein [Mycobacteriales bacterium]